MLRSVIEGVGSALPKRIMTNADISKIVDTTDEWIVERTGIRARHIAAEDETTRTLAVQAARNALEHAKLTPADIDLIIVATSTPDRTFPATATQVQADLGITRGAAFNGNSLASAAQLNTLLAGNNFNTFQNTLEAAPFHNRLHVLVGGTMVTSASPADPLFWLHHAFIDKIWADWQTLHPGVNPPNPADVLQPAPIMTRTVAQVLDTRALGYIYA